MCVKFPSWNLHDWHIVQFWPTHQQTPFAHLESALHRQEVCFSILSLGVWATQSDHTCDANGATGATEGAKLKKWREKNQRQQITKILRKKQNFPAVLRIGKLMICYDVHKFPILRGSPQLSLDSISLRSLDQAHKWVWQKMTSWLRHAEEKSPRFLTENSFLDFPIVVTNLRLWWVSFLPRSDLPS